MSHPEIALKARTCTDLIGGSQDNGTWSYNLNPTAVDSTWFESVSGDGGQSLIDTGNPNILMHNPDDLSSWHNRHDVRRP